MNGKSDGDFLLKAIHTHLDGMTAIPPEQYQNFKKIFQLQRMVKGEYWIHAGTKEHRVGIIASGLFRMYYTGDNFEEYTKDFCKTGDFLSSYSSLLLNDKSALSIQAMSDSELLVAPYEKYRSLEDSHPCWNRLSRKIAEQLFVKKEKREMDLLLLDAKQRYLKFKEEYPELSLLIPQYQIASFLGISPVSLSRIKKSLD